MQSTPFTPGGNGSAAPLSGTDSQNAELIRLQHELKLGADQSRLQERLVVFICSCVRLGLVGALAIFILQGFGNRSGFHLADAFMHWIGSATLGCVSTLAILVYKCFFARPCGSGSGARARKPRA